MKKLIWKLEICETGYVIVLTRFGKCLVKILSLFARDKYYIYRVDQIKTYTIDKQKAWDKL